MHKTDARHLPLSVPTVMVAHRAHRAYLAGSRAAVNVKPRGRKRAKERQPKPEQETNIGRLICDKTPGTLKMGFALWNRQAVAPLVRDRPGIELPIRTVGEYLKCSGVTPQKPCEKANKQRPAEMRKWLD